MVHHNALGACWLLVLLVLLEGAHGGENSASNRCGEEPGVQFLASYPRSGSHYVRRLIEEVTGITTFSQYPDGALDSHPEEPVHGLWKSPAPQHRGVAAYAPNGGYAGNRTWPSGLQRMLVKTHWPKQYGGLKTLNADASFETRRSPALCLHRFPLDAIASFIRYQTPALPPTRALQGNTAVTIDLGSLRRVASNWTAWHEYWLARNGTTAVSFERLLEDPEGALAGVLEELDRPTSWSACPPRPTPLDLKDAVARAIALYPPRRSAFLSSRHFFTKLELREMAAEIVDSTAVRELGYREQLLGILAAGQKEEGVGGVGVGVGGVQEL